MIFIDNSGLTGSRLQVDVTHEQGYLILRIQAVPHSLRKAVDLSLQFNDLRLPLKAGQRISVVHVGVDKTSLSLPGLIVGVGISAAAGGIPLVALQNCVISLSSKGL